MFYQMISGVHPFTRSASIDTASAILNDPLPSVPALGEATTSLKYILAKLVAKDPEARHRSATAVLIDLRELQRESDAAMPQVLGSHHDSFASLPSIAVLPFADLSEQHDQAHFSEGLAEEIISALSRLDGVRVVARSSSFRFRGTSLDLQDVGRILRVGRILEGSVRQSGARLRVSVRLVDTSDGCQQWAEQFDRDMKDIFALQDEISRKVAETLELRLVGPGLAGDRHSRNMAAYNLYLKGRYFWNKRTAEGIQRGIEHLEQAILADPNYALAYAGLADAYVLLAMHASLPAPAVCPKAKRAAERALDLNDTLGAGTRLARVRAGGV